MSSLLYDKKAKGYSYLPWVSDNTIFEQIIPSDISGFRGVLDLACGTGMLGKYIMTLPGLPMEYIGVDSSQNMLDQAKRTLEGLDATLILADILKYFHPASLPRFLCVIKNSLHLIPNYRDLIVSLPERFGVRRLVIVETVSPDAESLAWIKTIFSKLPSSKRNWFVRGQLRGSLSGQRIKILRDCLYEQFIDVIPWFNNFGISPETLEILLDMMAVTPDVIRQRMKIEKTVDGYKMLRLQNILEVEFV